MAVDPISLGVAVASAGLNFFGSQNKAAAAKQDYVNQTAYQDATSEFNSWQASFNAQTRDLNNQYSYWGETLNYNQRAIYSGQLTNYQFAQEMRQAQNVIDTRVSAGQAYAAEAEALQAAVTQRGMQEAVALQQYQYRALQASSSFRAAAQEGKSMDRYVRNFARQAGDANSIAQINTRLRNGQYKREQMSAITKYLSRYNSQNFYIKSPIQEPTMPFAPLPTMVTPPGPTMRGAAPTSNTFLTAGNALLGGANTYLNVAGQIKALKDGTK